MPASLSERPIRFNPVCQGGRGLPRDDTMPARMIGAFYCARSPFASKALNYYVTLLKDHNEDLEHPANAV